MMNHDAVRNTLPPPEMRALPAFRISTVLIFTLSITIVILVYVWSHIQITRLEYEVAEAIHTKEQLLEAQRRLKLEVATLKSHQRIEAIARDHLQMTYPEPGQVIVIK
jgi:cell division protein FtsL